MPAARVWQAVAVPWVVAAPRRERWVEACRPAEGRLAAVSVLPALLFLRGLPLAELLAAAGRPLPVAWAPAVQQVVRQAQGSGPQVPWRPRAARVAESVVAVAAPHPAEVAWRASSGPPAVAAEWSAPATWGWLVQAARGRRAVATFAELVRPVHLAAATQSSVELLEVSRAGVAVGNLLPAAVEHRYPGHPRGVIPQG
jgi:hypothetical protein